MCLEEETSETNVSIIKEEEEEEKRVLNRSSGVKTNIMEEGWYLLLVFPGFTYFFAL